MDEHVCSDLCIPELQVRIVKTDPPITPVVRRVDKAATVESPPKPEVKWHRDQWN